MDILIRLGCLFSQGYRNFGKGWPCEANADSQFTSPWLPEFLTMAQPAQDRALLTLSSSFSADAVMWSLRHRSMSPYPSVWFCLVWRLNIGLHWFLLLSTGYLLLTLRKSLRCSLQHWLGPYYFGHYGYSLNKTQMDGMSFLPILVSIKPSISHEPRLEVNSRLEQVELNFKSSGRPF